MAGQKTEIIGVLVDVKFPASCEGFFIGAIQVIVDGAPAERVKICGGADPDELKLHLTYRWYGKWENNERWGPQFKVETFTIAKPHGRTGVVKYLQQAPHIGEATAIQLWNMFNSDAVRIAREHPDLIHEKLPRLKPEQCREIASTLADLSNLEDTNIELIDLLNGRGFPKATARGCVKKWGNKALRILQSDPYKLMAFRGGGFLRCDSMWMDLGLPPAKMKRQCYAIWYSLASDSDGHTWHDETKARQFLKAKIAGVEVDFEKALALAKRAKIVRELRYCNRCRGTGIAMVPDLFTGEELVEAECQACNGGRSAPRWLADERRAAGEDRIAEFIAQAAFEKSAWPEIKAAAPGERGPTEHQAAELQRAMSQGTIAMLLGSPGTGKTFVAAAVIKAILSAGGKFDVAICAPTGKAAVRCTESMAGYGIGLRACTIHSLLRVAQGDDDAGGWKFEHDERNPLPYRYIIVDESSMIAVPLMKSLLAARAKGAHILFVGDPNQLPPIEHGAPLRDFITAGLPHGKLTEIKRNAGTIVRACAAIRDNRPVEIDSEIELERACPACRGSGQAPPALTESGEFADYECTTCFGSGKDPAFSPHNLKLATAGKAQAPAAIEKIILELRDKGIDPIWQVQVIVAVNKRSPLARTVFNKRLQELLNPGGTGVIGSPFKTGDKVICLKNSFFKPDDPDLGDATKVAVANGEFGKVYKVEAKKTCIEFFNPSRRVVVGRFQASGKGEKDDDAGDDKETGSGCDIDLGYAVSCHKMQGSDADHIIIALDEYPGATGPRGICKREWVFTAISRARISAHLVGLRSTLRTQCAETSLDKRKTFLAELIERYRKSYQPGKEQPCTTPAILSAITAENLISPSTCSS